MWLFPLVLFLHSGQAYDGCGRDRWRCGDVCILDATPCHCGGQTTFFRGENRTLLTWCCAETNSNCTGVGSIDEDEDGAYWDKGATCSAGQVLELTQPCPKTSPSITNTTKKQTKEDLGGEATDSCNYNIEGLQIDERDIGLRSYVPCWGPKQTIKECFKKNHEGDQKYHCKNRRDEKPFSANRHVLFEHTNLLEDCIDDSEKKGLSCGKKCLRFDSWCQEKPIGLKGPIMCNFPNGTEFHSNDKRLCEHPTFWKDKNCTDYRCNGAFPGQCGFTVATLGADKPCNDGSDHFYHEATVEGSCPDSTSILCTAKNPPPLPKGCNADDYDLDDYPDNYENFNKGDDIEDYRMKFCDQSSYKICIKKNSISRCDRHLQCEHGEDEVGCEKEYLSKGIFPQTDTFMCTESYYDISNPNGTSWKLYTHRAIRCDGKPTCPHGEDEKGCNILAATVKLAIPLTLLVLLLISLGSSPVLKKIFHEDVSQADNLEGPSKNLKILTGTDTVVAAVINDEHIKESLMILQHLDIPAEKRRSHNTRFINCLAEVEESKSAAFLWMKTNLYQQTCGQMLDDYDYGSCMKITVGYIKDFFLSLRSCFHDTFIQFCNRVRRTTMIYLDFIKDTCILVAMFYLLGQAGALVENDFPSTLAWIFFCSLVIPLFMSALETAWCQPFAVLGQSGWEKYTKEPPSKRKLWGIRVGVVLLFFFVPSILTNNREDAKTKKETLLRKSTANFEVNGEIRDSLHKGLRSTQRYIEESTKALLIFKTHELAIEKIMQLVIQATMVLLSPAYTQYPTSSGFQALFEPPEDSGETAGANTELSARGLYFHSQFTLNVNLGEFSLYIFIGSIILGFYTTANSYVLIKKEEKKNFLPFMPRLVLIVRSLLVYSTRMFSIITFFGVFLGLLDILAHWHADRFPSADADNDWEVPSYTNYTGHNIGTALGVFSLILLVQALVILFMKRNLSKAFKEASFSAKLDHILISLNRPDFFADWELGDGNVFRHEERQKSVLKEAAAMISVHFFFNLALFYPVWLTAIRVNAVHRDRVFPFPEEEKAKELLDYLSWVAPLVTFLASLADLGLVYLYQKSFHPWRRILADDAGDEPETKLFGGNSIYKMTVGPPVLQDKDKDNASDSV